MTQDDKLVYERDVSAVNDFHTNKKALLKDSLSDMDMEIACTSKHPADKSIALAISISLRID